MKLPRFQTPKPLDGETYEWRIRRIGEEFERFVNEELTPALAGEQHKEKQG